MAKNWIVLLIFGMFLLEASTAQGQTDRTVHNLSASKRAGRGSSGESCTFCHIPHTAGANRAIWNPNQPPTIYTLYTSSTLEAKLNQPTGTSRLCLSCHDGITAMGSLRATAAGTAIQSALSGSATLGVDLSDDHPLSFVFDSTLASRREELSDPALLPRTLPLDGSRQLQCTTCHDPHNDRYRKSLRMDDTAGALCNACHRLRNWPASVHAASSATRKGGRANPWPHTPYGTVLTNGCMNCHRAHSAPRPAHLLNSAQERSVCLVCHSGNVADKNLNIEFQKSSRHDISSTNWTHTPREDPNTMPRHVACTDCHNPHQTRAASSGASPVMGPLRGVSGLNITGRAVASSSFEYEVCLKCHGVQDQVTLGRVVRQDNTRNVRLELNPSNPSFHPVAAGGKNSRMRGFEPGYSTASIVTCTDCHNNDEWTPRGGQPRGAHGSRYTPILEREYQVDDPASESFQSYALCYKCHNRSFLIGDQAGTFSHQRHIVTAQSPCAVCHDAHGSRQSPGLVNFMLRDRTGKTIVSPSLTQRRLEHIPLGPGRGQCFLSCHGKNHEPLSYP